MRWGRHWPERVPRPKVKPLSIEKKKQILTTFNKGIESSPVLSSLCIRMRPLRGRFYLERVWNEPDEQPEIEVIGRITPLTSRKHSFLLEVEKSKGNWYEVKRGKAEDLINLVASDTKGTFHGLGVLDNSLRKAGGALNRLEVEMQENFRFVYKKTGQLCTVQEAMFHYFGIPIDVIAEPREWYIYHRQPRIIEVSEDRTKVLIEFSAMSISWGTFGGICLYAKMNNNWNAFRIKPNQSKDISTAIVWLKKRKWEDW